jgi:predicted acetyltransferase
MAEADIEAAAAVQTEAFGGVLAEAISRYHDGPRATWRDGWVVESGGEIRAVAIAIPATWWFRGRSYPISAVAGVAVRPVDRRRGLASRLVRAILHADRAAGRPFSLLYPFQHGFYRRLGYGSVGLGHFWRLPTAHLPDAPSLRAHVRMLRAADRPLIGELFAQAVRTSPAGGLERPAGHWQRRLSQDDRWVVYEDEAGIGGYLAYRTAVANTLEIRELVTVHPEAERGLWAFVAAQVEQRAAVSYLAPVGLPLWAMLREPYMFQGPQHGFIMNDVAGLTMSFMARGVDWPAALSSRGYPEHLRGALGIELQDSVFGQQRIGLEIADGRGSVSEFSGEVDVTCDTSVFSQLCCGALTASAARWYGLLQADDAAVALLDEAFPEGPPFITQFDWF